MDLGPPDHDQMHMLNLELSITLVKSNGCDLISHSANDSVTRGELWTLRTRSNGGNQGIVEPTSWDRGPLIVHYVASS